MGKNKTTLNLWYFLLSIFWLNILILISKQIGFSGGILYSIPTSIIHAVNVNLYKGMQNTKFHALRCVFDEFRA